MTKLTLRVSQNNEPVSSYAYHTSEKSSADIRVIVVTVVTLHRVRTNSTAKMWTKYFSSASENPFYLCTYSWHLWQRYDPTRGENAFIDRSTICTVVYMFLHIDQQIYIIRSRSKFRWGTRHYSRVSNCHCIRRSDTITRQRDMYEWKCKCSRQLSSSYNSFHLTISF